MDDAQQKFNARKKYLKDHARKCGSFGKTVARVKTFFDNRSWDVVGKIERRPPGCGCRNDG